MPRGGGRGGRPRGPPPPFAIDPEIEEEADRALAEGQGEQALTKDLFPETELVAPAPVTADERRTVLRKRGFEVRRRASAFWTGDEDDDDNENRAGEGADLEPDLGDFDPFEGVPSYANRGRKRRRKVANLTRIKLHPEYFAKECRSCIGVRARATRLGAGAVKLGGRKVLPPGAKAAAVTADELARFDVEGAMVGRAKKGDGDEGDGDGDGDAEEGEDGDAVSELLDDDFEEDEDDADDYNAEQYFDGGEEDFEEAGGDEYEEGY